MDIVYRLLDTAAVVIEGIMCFVFVASFMKENKIRSHFILLTIAVLLNVIVNYMTVSVEVYSVFCFLYVSEFYAEKSNSGFRNSNVSLIIID